jgi:CubicO group peptidase (beta-lactamase class C family)
LPISGYCDPGFLKVKKVFEHNFFKGGELGAACCVYIDGRKVVDLWGGFADKNRTKPWKENTLVAFYSAGKPFAALAVLQLVDSGALSLDAPVCRWWPEFSAAGKEKITVRQVLCHQAGLAAVRKRLSDDNMLDWQFMTAALAEQPRWDIPGYHHAYHTNTYGFLAGELVRRVSGMAFGSYFQEKIAKPLEADLCFGVEEDDLPRVAELVWRPSGEPPDPAKIDQPMSDRERLVWHCYFNPPGFSSLGVMNTRRWRTAVIPSSNGHGTARGIAKIYSVLSRGGEFGGYRLLSPEILGEATRVQSQGSCPVLDTEVSFCLGFQRTRPDRPLGPNKRSYGHYGTGGSLGFADPDAGLGFGYVLNDILPKWQNSRNHALVDAVYDCI